MEMRKLTRVRARGLGKALVTDGRFECHCSRHASTELAMKELTHGSILASFTILANIKTLSLLGSRSYDPQEAQKIVMQDPESRRDQGEEKFLFIRAGSGVLLLFR